MEVFTAALGADGSPSDYKKVAQYYEERGDPMRAGEFWFLFKDYAKALRRTLDDAGFKSTKVVANDGGADICDTLKKDPAYAKNVDIIGLHYPSDYSDYATCHALDKPV